MILSDIKQYKFFSSSVPSPVRASLLGLAIGDPHGTCDRAPEGLSGTGPAYAGIQETTEHVSGISIGPASRPLGAPHRPVRVRFPIHGVIRGRRVNLVSRCLTGGEFASTLALETRSPDLCTLTTSPRCLDTPVSTSDLTALVHGLFLGADSRARPSACLRFAW